MKQNEGKEGWRKEYCDDKRWKNTTCDFRNISLKEDFDFVHMDRTLDYLRMSSCVGRTGVLYLSSLFISLYRSDWNIHLQKKKKKLGYVIVHMYTFFNKTKNNITRANYLSRGEMGRLSSLSLSLSGQYMNLYFPAKCFHIPLSVQFYLTLAGLQYSFLSHSANVICVCVSYLFQLLPHSFDSPRTFPGRD